MNRPYSFRRRLLAATLLSTVSLVLTTAQAAAAVSAGPEYSA